jgi:hypothetical protein
LLASEAIDGIAVAPQARRVGMRLPAQIHIVNHAVVRWGSLILANLCRDLILAVFGGHITRRSTDASMSGRRALVRSLTSLRRNRPGIRTVLGFRGDERENRAGLALAAWPVGSVRMCVRMRFSWGGDTEDC